MSLSQKRSYEALKSEFTAKKMATNQLIERMKSQDTEMASASLLFSYLYSIYDADYSNLKSDVNLVLEHLHKNPWEFIRSRKLSFIVRYLGIQKGLWFWSILKKYLNIL